MQDRVEFVGLIPIREGSQRVIDKNFKEFANNRSLFEIKIGHLKNAGCFDHIYVSSDSEKAKLIAQANGIEFLRRDSRMCRDDVLLAEVISHIMDTIPGDPVVVWALATSPLFSDFAGAVRKYQEKRKEYDSLVAVLPKKSFFLNRHGRGINYNPGYWHPYSQQLETYFEVTGACYIGRKSNMLKWSYWFGPKPYRFETINTQSIDVDTPQDFELAQKLYEVMYG